MVKTNISMADWDYIQCGYNALDETINFGTRSLAGLDNLYETSTLAVIKNTDGEVSSSPFINSFINNGSVFFSINKSLRIFKDLLCSEVSFSVTFEDVVDTFCVTLNGKLLCVCLRNGCVTLFNIENDPTVLFQYIVFENENVDKQFFIKAVPVETVLDVTFYIVCSDGKLFRVVNKFFDNAGGDLKMGDSYSLVIDLKKPLEHVNIIYPILLYTCSYGAFLYNVTLKKEISLHINSFKKMYLCNASSCLGLTHDGKLMNICTKTGLKYAMNVDIPYDDVILIQENDSVIIAITKKDELGVSYIKLMTYPGNKTIFSLKVSGKIYLITPEHIHDEIIYISEIRDNDEVKELRFQTISETVPENRFQRLLRREKFNDAEHFAKLFNLDLTEIQKARAQIIVDKSVCDEADITNLIEILSGINDVVFKMRCCLDTHSCCASLDDVERILDYMKSISVSESSTDIQEFQSFGSELMFRFHTFSMLLNVGYLRNSPQDWFIFSTCDLIAEVHTLLEEGRIEETEILYSRLDSASLENLQERDITNVLDNVNKMPMENQLSFLNCFIPLSLSYLPTSASVFIKWIIDNVYYLERTYFNEFPEIALKFLNKTVVLLKLECTNQLSFQHYPSVDQHLLKDLENITDTLKKLQNLKNDHRIVTPLQHLLQGTEKLIPGILSALAQNETVLKQFIEKFVQDNHVEMFGEMVEDMVTYEEECWIKVVPIVLSYMRSLSKKLQATIVVLKSANIPWCEAIRKIATDCLQYSHPLVNDIIQEIKLEPKSVVLRKDPYKIMRRYDDTQRFQEFAINRILFYNEPTMVEDIYVICNDSKKSKLEANISIIHHFIKLGDFRNALKVIDNESKLNRYNLCKQMIEYVQFAINNQYKMDSIQENYYKLIDSLSAYLHEDEHNQNTLQKLKNVYYIQRRFKSNTLYNELIQGTDNGLLKKLVAIVIDEYNHNNNITMLINACDEITIYLQLDTKSVLIELCKQIKDYNVLVNAAEALYENTNDAKSLCEMAKLLLVGVGSRNIFIQVMHMQTWTDYESVDLKLFIVGLKLARKIMMKAILHSSEFYLYHCIELTNWTEMTFFLTRTKSYWDTKIYNDVYDSDAMTSSLFIFNGISIVFKFYMQIEDNSDQSISNVHNSNSGVNESKDYVPLDVQCLKSTIASLSAEGESYMAFKLIDVLYRSLMYHQNINSELLENLNQILQKCSKQLLQQMFSSSSFDINFAFHLLIMSNDVAYSKRFLMQSLKHYKRNLTKFESIAQTSLLFLKSNNIEDGQFLCTNILYLTKWWKRLKNCGIPYEEFFRQQPNEILSKLIKLNHLNTTMINKFCAIANLDVQEYYKLYLESLLLNWQPKYRNTVNVCGIEKLIMDFNKDEFFRNCLEVVHLITCKDSLLDLIRSIWENVNFYHYEVFFCIVDLLSSLNATTDSKERLLVLSFLNTYNRVSKPSEAEIEQWFTLYPDTQSIDDLSKWRLPFTPTLQTHKIWSIIRPEVNLKTYTKWFKAIVFFKNLHQDDICSYVIKDIMSSGVFQSESTDEWMLYAKYEDLLKKIDVCIQNIHSYELATATLYSLIPYIPKGVDKVNAVTLCYKYALKYQQQNPNSVDVQKAVIKVHRKYLHFSIMHILHLNKLADKKYLEIIGRPVDDLIKILYMDDRIIKKAESICTYCPDINKAVDQIAKLHEIDIEAKRIDLLGNWLSAPFSTKMNVSFSNNSVCCSDIESENLIRASYLCTSGDVTKWQSYLLSVGNVEVNESKNLSFKAMALKCFCNISTVDVIEELTSSTYEAFRNFINKLSLISNLENFGFCLTIEALDKYNKSELVIRLSYHMNNPTAVKMMASICMTYTIYENKYWMIITVAMIKLHMFQELRESISFLKKNIAVYSSQWYIDAWQHIINNAFNSMSNFAEKTIREQCIDVFLVIQACPVSFLLQFDLIVKKLLSLKQYDFIALSLQYIKDNNTQNNYIKELVVAKEDLCDNLNELRERGFLGVNRVKRILSEFEDNGNYVFHCCADRVKDKSED